MDVNPIEAGRFYLARMGDGSRLPEWLKFDNEEMEIWGVPTSVDLGCVELRIFEASPYSDEEEKCVGVVIIEVSGRRKP